MKLLLATKPPDSGYAEQAELKIGLQLAQSSSAYKRVSSVPELKLTHDLRAGSLDLSLPHPLKFSMNFC